MTCYSAEAQLNMFLLLLFFSRIIGISKLTNTEPKKSPNICRLVYKDTLSIIRGITDALNRRTQVTL